MIRIFFLLALVGLGFYPAGASPLRWQLGEVESASLTHYPRTIQRLEPQLALRVEEIRSAAADLQVRRITRADLLEGRLDARETPVLVIPDRIEEAPSQALMNHLREFIRSGGGLFLVSRAIAHAYDLDLETLPCSDLDRNYRSSNYSYGFSPMVSEHPLWSGLEDNSGANGAFLLNGASDASRLQISCWKGHAPSTGTSLGRFARIGNGAYRAFNEYILVEWTLGRGKAVGYGLNWRFDGTEGGSYQVNREAFLRNVLRYLSPPGAPSVVGYLDLGLEESWVPRLSDEFADIRRQKCDYSVHAGSGDSSWAGLPQVVGGKDVGVEDLQIRTLLEPGFYRLTIRYLEEQKPNYYLVVFDDQEIGSFYSCARGHDGTDVYNVQSISFPLVCREPGEHRVGIQIRPGGWGSLFLDALTLERVSSLAVSDSREAEIPGRVALDLWGWYAPSTYQRASEAGVGLDYFKIRVMDESFKRGANLVEFFHNFFFPHFRWPIPWDESDPERPAGYQYAESAFWTRETLQQLTDEAHRRDMLLQWYQFPAGFADDAQKAAGLRHIARGYGNALSLSPYRSVDGMGLEAFNLEPRKIWDAVRPFAPGMYIYDLNLNPREVYPNFSPSMMAAHNLEPEGYDDRMPVIPKAADDLYLFRGINWPGPLATHRPQGRLSIGYQIECRYRRPPEGPFADTWAFGGGAYPDWVIKQCNDFFRPRYQDPEHGEPSAIWWINEVENVTDNGQRRYVYAVSMDPIKAALAADLRTTGRGGYFEAHTLQDPEANAWSRFTFRPREVFPAETTFIQNNFFRLCLSPPRGEGILLYDPEHTAHYDNDSLRYPIVEALPRTDLSRGTAYSKDSIDIIEVGGHQAVVVQTLASHGATLQGTESRRYTICNDAPWVKVVLHRALEKFPEVLSTSFPSGGYDQARFNGMVLEEGQPRPLGKGLPWVELKDSRQVYPTLLVILLDRGGVESVSWQAGSDLSFQSPGEREEHLSLAVVLAQGFYDEPQYDALAKALAQELPGIRCSADGALAEIVNEHPVPLVRVVQVEGNPDRPYLVQERGWWVARGAQPSLESPGADYVKVYLPAQGASEIQPYGMIRGVVKPGWGCQYILALGQVEPRATGAGCVAKVLSLTSYLFSPRLEFSRPVHNVRLNGEAWHYYDGPFVFLPNRKGDYRVEVEYREPASEVRPRIACTYAVPEESRLEGGRLVFNAALPEWMHELPPEYPLAALIRHEGLEIATITGARTLQDNKGLGSVIEFLPGTIEIEFEEPVSR